MAVNREALRRKAIKIQGRLVSKVHAIQSSMKRLDEEIIPKLEASIGVLEKRVVKHTDSYKEPTKGFERDHQDLLKMRRELQVAGEARSILENGLSRSLHLGQGGRKES